MAKNSNIKQTVAALNAAARQNAEAKQKAKTAVKRAQAKVAKQAAKAKTQAVKDIKKDAVSRVRRFLGVPIDFTMADVEKKFAKVKNDDLRSPRSYHVAVGKGKDVRQISIPDFIEQMTGIKLVWKTGQTGNPVGTYSTGNAAKFFSRMGFDVRTRDGQKLVVEEPVKTPQAGTKEMAEKMAKLREARGKKPAESPKAREKEAVKAVAQNNAKRRNASKK